VGFAPAESQNRIDVSTRRTGENQLATPPTAIHVLWHCVEFKRHRFLRRFGIQQVGNLDPEDEMELRDYLLPYAASPQGASRSHMTSLVTPLFSSLSLCRLDPRPQSDRVSFSERTESEPMASRRSRCHLLLSIPGRPRNPVVRRRAQTHDISRTWSIPGGGNIVRNLRVTPDCTSCWPTAS